MNIAVPQNCGNSPKQVFLRDYVIAVAERDRELLARFLATDAEWNLVSDGSTGDVNNFLASLGTRLRGRVNGVEIDSIITHGDLGSVNGTFILTKGRVVSFCDVYRFSGHGKSAKLRNITSYWV